jgi:hypothetical protein
MVREPILTVTIDAEFIKSLDAHFRAFPAAIASAFPIAINDAIRFGRKVAAAEITKQVAFPAGYLDEPERLYVAQFATAANPSAVVAARGRGTSLLRFALGGPTPESTRGAGVKKGQPQRRGPGVTIMVKPGVVKTIPEAFVVQLNNGNMGVAVKLKDGHFPVQLNKQKIVGVLAKNDLYILYGPSVDQVFRTVAQDVSAEVTSELAAEFRRQFFVQLGRA